MKFSALGATLMAATFAVATPAFAKHTHTHHKGHAAKTEAHKKAEKSASATDDLNARTFSRLRPRFRQRRL
ncbi:hypothetical protein [Asaia astilbis]|uniref:hypothetical protein n=1 Tax=Asaia astilbis TaxID=610244 RepID=UPI001E4C1F18|nr:hypothetical protein [Asaia astilbis]